MYIDRKQGINADGNAFGYIGDGTRQGWFFDWPSHVGTHDLQWLTRITDADAEAMVASLAVDDMDDSPECIPREDAERELRQMLDGLPLMSEVE